MIDLTDHIKKQPKMGIKEWLLRAWFAGMVAFVIFYMTGIVGYAAYFLVALILGLVSTFLIDPITSTMKYGNISMFSKEKHGMFLNTLKNIVISFVIVALIAFVHTLVLQSNLGNFFGVDYTIVNPIVFGLVYQLLHLGIFLLWHKLLELKKEKKTSSK